MFAEAFHEFSHFLCREVGDGAAVTFETPVEVELSRLLWAGLELGQGGADDLGAGLALAFNQPLKARLVFRCEVDAGLFHACRVARRATGLTIVDWVIVD